MYGRKEEDPGSCSCGILDIICNTNCGNQDALRKVTDRCEGWPSCQFRVNNKFFGNPCFWTSKYLELEYQCVLKQGIQATVFKPYNSN